MWIRDFWNDEAGVVLSAETVLVGSIGVLGVMSGLNMAASAVDAELKEVAFAFRSLDQSYSVSGRHSCGAYTAGSCYSQQPIEQSLVDLGAAPEAARATREGDDCKTMKSGAPCPAAAPAGHAPAAVPNDLPSGK